MGNFEHTSHLEWEAENRLPIFFIRSVGEYWTGPVKNFDPTYPCHHRGQLHYISGMERLHNALYGIRALILVALTLIALPAPVSAAPNEIVQFLEGEWWNVDITITEESGVRLNEYREMMVVKDDQTLTVTAYKIKEGQDVTKDITIKMTGDSVTLAQEGFEAHGVKTGNFISLSGTAGDFRIEFRLYLMGDTYIYQKDVRKDGEVIESQMSYLERIIKPGD